MPHGPEKGLWAVYGLKKGLANGLVKGLLVMDGTEKAVL